MSNRAKSLAQIADELTRRLTGMRDRSENRSAYGLGYAEGFIEGARWASDPVNPSQPSDAQVAAALNPSCDTRTGYSTT